MNIEKIGFECAKKLMKAGFPQPENLKKGQIWYLPNGERVLIDKHNVVSLSKIFVFHNPGAGTEFYEPTHEDFVQELPDWGITVEGLSFVCVSDKSPEKKYEGRTQLEAWTEAWIKIKGEHGAPKNEEKQ